MFADLRFAPPKVELIEWEDGATIVRSPEPLKPYARCVTEWLVHWARKDPNRLFLSERQGAGYMSFTYSDVLRMIRATGRGLLDFGASPSRPVMILSGNSIEHAVVSLACQHIGVPVAPISEAYSLQSTDFAKLRAIYEVLKPAVIYVEDASPFAAALEALALNDTKVIATRNAPRGMRTTRDLFTMTNDGRAEARFEKIAPDSVAKILFTSGSTGEPKGVINTHRMLTSNQQMIAQCWPFLEDPGEPPIIVDWLPWSHTFGGNHNFNLVMRNGGTLYINKGRPTALGVEETLRTLRDNPPTLYFDVPRGFEVLLPYLEQDEDLCERFFRRLKLVFYAGADLPQPLWDRLRALSVKARGDEVVMASAWGSTETAPLVTSVHFPIERSGVIGLPAPGCSIKLVANGDKREMRVRGPNVTPGYFGRDDLTAEAFDEEGFYKIGDAGRFVDPAEPAKGLAFDGRVAEDFKLSTGTWVHVGRIRVDVVGACAPYASDAVITGHDRSEVGALLFPQLDVCRDLAGLGHDAPAADVLAHPAVRSAIERGLATQAEKSFGSSLRVARAMLLTEPPSIDAGEITDKGYINQRAVLTARAAWVEALYDDSDSRVLRIGS